MEQQRWRKKGMKELREAIETLGRAAGTNVVKVDMFLNHRIETELLFKMGKVLADYFRMDHPTQILTVESSGIALALTTAHFLGDIPVVFAKKSPTVVQSDDVVQAPVYSFTHKVNNMIRVDKHYLPIHSNVLIVDDFLADGQAASGMISLCEQLECKPIGVGIGIEKGFQPGGRILREKGVKLKSLAIVEKIEDGKIFLAPDEDD